MSIRNKKLLTLGALCLGMVAVTMSSFRKDENTISRRNLKVIPKSVSDEELIGTMKDISRSLGVKCNYCHVSKENPSMKEGRPAHDFASDDKEAKHIARKMMRMTADINEKLLDIGNGKMEKVTCNTCHRGHTEPSFFDMPKPPGTK